MNDKETFSQNNEILILGWFESRKNLVKVTPSRSGTFRPVAQETWMVESFRLGSSAYQGGKTRPVPSLPISELYFQDQAWYFRASDHDA